ncbi:hypothetical protein [Shewanella psychrotolerans]|uniref:hypothetical protein n=1 Tax=Shewanella psychrotolerans TaxID=2864206 RepID=UPI001C65A38E|nr:hypothetical protein [Shewanella psychrotolerans]QYK03078.1 hypothetical protein K0I62_09235 [Shewanella psychrotolerans]
MEFPAHGSVEISCSNQIIVANIGGPWNLELIKIYREKMVTLFNQLKPNEPWGLIVCIHNSATCPPDAIELIKKGVQSDSIKNHRICTSYVISKETEGRRLMDPIWRKIYLNVMPFEIFPTLDEAMNWTEMQISNSNT